MAIDHDYNAAWFLSALDEARPFVFSRWGDGEWHAVLGRLHGSNCDGHPYSQGLGETLRDVLLSRPPYLLGMQGLAMRVMGSGIVSWLRKHDLLLPWVPADVFHYMTIRGQHEKMIKAFAKRRVVVVGPPHLRKLQQLVPFVDFVQVPPRNAFASLADLCIRTLELLAKTTEPTVVSVSAGMPAKALIHRLFLEREITQAHALVDMGAVWDPFCGVNSRSYMRKLSLK